MESVWEGAACYSYFIEESDEAITKAGAIVGGAIQVLLDYQGRSWGDCRRAPQNLREVVSRLDAGWKE